MSIDRTSTKKPVSTIHTRKTSDTTIQKTRQKKTSAP
ncbi:flagellar biosynthesis anti-sigma factor FlgM, partial [Salmonella enterica subsp. enterica serovar Infantis]